MADITREEFDKAVKDVGELFVEIVNRAPYPPGVIAAALCVVFGAIIAACGEEGADKEVMLRQAYEGIKKNAGMDDKPEEFLH